MNNKYLVEILIGVLLLIIILVIVLNLFYFLIYRKKLKDVENKKFNFKYLLIALNLIFTVGIFALLSYLFVIPAKVNKASLKSGEAWLDYNKPLEIEFDKPVNLKKLKYSFSKQIKGEWRNEKVNNLDVFKRKLVFYPEETLLPDDEIKLTIENGEFIPLKKFDNYDLKFTSGTSKPTIDLITEINDRQNVNPASNIEISIPNVDKNSYILEVESVPQVEFKVKEIDKEKFELTHDVEFDTGTPYEVKLFITPVTYNLKTKEILNKGSKSQAATAKFQIANSPKLINASPKGNNVLSTENIQIEFDNEMDKKTVEEAISIEPKVEGTFEWNNEGTILKFDPKDNLSKDTSYKVLINKDIKSVYGAKLIREKKENTENTATEITQFKTIGAIGVMSTAPVTGAREVDTSTSISITFNQVVDKQSAESKFAITPDVVGKFSWNNNTLIFKPDNKLANSNTYTVKLNSGVKSIDGMDLKTNYTFNFTTKSNIVLLKAPIMEQAQQFACNVTAAAIALQYKGVNVSPWTVYQGIPKQTVKKENGYWGNPNLGYVGNIYGVWGGDKTEGYGVYWDPIRNYIAQFRPAEVKRGWNVTEMLKEIDNGNLSIIWWQNGVANPERLSWKSYDANGNEVTVTGVNGMHSQVVVGYIGTPENPQQIILSDPWASRHGYNYQYVSLSRFNSLWSYFNNTAVLVK